MNKIQALEQIRKLLQMFASSLDEERALEVSTIYDHWAADKNYNIDDYLAFGNNEVGDPQLYRVVQAHTSQADWTPDKTPSLYVAIGLDASGRPVWSQPTGAHDAYNKGDIVNFNGALYISLIDGNIYSPDTYPDGWEVYIEN